MSEWEGLDKEDVRFDPLLDGLILLTYLMGAPYARDALTAGLPIEAGKLDAKNFATAAERAGLSTRLFKRDLDSLSDLTLPALALLNGKQVAIILAIDKDKKCYSIMRPETGKSEEIVSFENLEKEYLGYVYLIKKHHRFDGRQEDTLNIKVNHWFWGALAKSWKIYKDVLLVSVLVNLIVLAAPLYTRNVYDRVIPNNAMDTLWTFTIGVFIAYTFDLFLRIIRAYFLDLAGKKSDVMLSALIFEKVQASELGVRPKSVGTFSKQLTDFDSIRDMITSSTMTLLIDLPFTLLFLFVIYLIGSTLVFVPIVAMIFILLFSIYAHNAMKYTVEQTYKASAEKNGLLYETLSSPESVKAYNMQSRNQKKWEDVTGEISGWSIKTKMLSTAVGSWSNYVQQIATVASVVLGVYLISDAKLTMGGLIAVSMLLGRTIAPMRQVASLVTRLHGAKEAFASLDKLMANPVEIDKEKTYLQKDKLDGGFEFKEVDFAYPEAGILALHNISFTIKPGEKVGVLGRIGSGKSTLGKLLLRFYLPSKGAIYVDGKDINQLSPHVLRKNIGYIPQHVHLFFGTIKDNIKIGVEYIDDARVQMVAEMAGVTDFTDKHPKGLDMVVGEMGQNLSGGQRQLVALARALILFPKILIMDEPSSSMDQASEKILLDRLKHIVKDRTLIIATHRASLLALVDNLMVIESGQLVAFGSKADVKAQLNKQPGSTL
ncbi:MAG: type I secretion system permease/ATPase [Candidatus Endonucleobacter bathymodioli]|uniref:Type I secretion system permease/ATPase n=1 Tax=Candidatus Endonucleibacter bathymodioli TaxID=539814 RepID=A0AA90ST58_9GAMM|nr:type I secretion system permease/ATPase [Candidatus Endonucleobacter bathymodioli]